jgi:hypothetical protein
MPGRADGVGEVNVSDYEREIAVGRRFPDRLDGMIPDADAVSQYPES